MKLYVTTVPAFEWAFLWDFDMNRRSFFVRSIAAIATMAAVPMTARANQLREVIPTSPTQPSKVVVLADRFCVMNSAAGAPNSVFVVQNDAAVIDSALIHPTRSIKVAVNPHGTRYLAGIGVVDEAGALA